MAAPLLVAILATASPSPSPRPAALPVIASARVATGSPQTLHELPLAASVLEIEQYGPFGVFQDLGSGIQHLGGLGVQETLEFSRLEFVRTRSTGATLVYAYAIAPALRISLRGRCRMLAS